MPLNAKVELRTGEEKGLASYIPSGKALKQGKVSFTTWNSIPSSIGQSPLQGESYRESLAIGG
jgi:hypothetical protein